MQTIYVTTQDSGTSKSELQEEQGSHRKSKIYLVDRYVGHIPCTTLLNRWKN